MNLDDWNVKRRIIAGIAIISWIAVAIFYVTDPESEMFFASSIRIGLLTSAIWLAMPRGSDPPNWANISPKWWVTLGIGCLLGMYRPKLFPFIMVMFGIIGFLWKSKGGPPAPRQKKKKRASRNESPSQNVNSSS